MSIVEKRNYGTYKQNGIPISAIPKPSYGNVFFTGNATIAGQDTATDDPGYGDKPSRPFATITYGLSKMVANRGDTLYVLPGHTETITAASGLDINVAGANIMGLGRGTLRPTITLGTIDSVTIAMSAANCVLDNFRFPAAIDDIVSGIIVSAVACKISNNEFYQSATDKNYFTCIATDDNANSCDGLEIIGNKRYEIDTACLATISILEDQEGVVISKNKDVQTYGANVGHHVILGAFDMTNFECSHNILHMVGDNSAQTVGNLITGSSTASDGVVHHNLVGGVDVGGLLDTATLEFSHYENYFVGIAAKSGLILPAIA